jgi:isoprenylcysteine carboxyl methyltransferase (ICMT) family protein YpbQ
MDIDARKAETMNTRDRTTVDRAKVSVAKGVNVTTSLATLAVGVFLGALVLAIVAQYAVVIAATIVAAVVIAAVALAALVIRGLREQAAGERTIIAQYRQNLADRKGS